MARTMASLENMVRAAWPELKQRLARLEDRKFQLQTELEAVESKLSEAKKEFGILQNLAEDLNVDPMSPPQEVEKDDNRIKSYPYGSVTIKQAARLTLDAFRSGLDSPELLDVLSNRYFEGRLERTSFSPQLSRMNRDGEVELKDSVWVLTEKGRAIMAKQPMLPYHSDPKTNETADAGASEASDAASAKS